MLSVQDIVKSLYSDSPKPLYFFTGPEYGVKVEYLQLLASKYENVVEEYPSLLSLIKSFKQKSLFPRKPKLFIVRYDKEFISSLSDSIVKLVQTTNIVGTIVGIFQDDSDESKLNKYFPENTARVNLLSPNNSCKHLLKKFPNLPELYIKEVIRISSDFYQATLNCQLLSYLDSKELAKLSQMSIENLFGYTKQSDSSNFKLAIVKKDFKQAITEIEAYVGDLSQLFYDILSAMIEILKVIDKPYSESYAKQSVNKWTPEAVVIFYKVVYDELSKLRSTSTYSPYVSLIYVCGLLQFKLS